MVYPRCNTASPPSPPSYSLLISIPPPDKTHKQQKTSKNPCVPRQTEITHAHECPLWAYARRGVGPLPLPKGQNGSHRHHPFQQIPRSSIHRPPAHLLSIYFRRYLRQLIATLDQGVKNNITLGPSRSFDEKLSNISTDCQYLFTIDL